MPEIDYKTESKLERLEGIEQKGSAKSRPKEASVHLEQGRLKNAAEAKRALGVHC